MMQASMRRFVKEECRPIEEELLRKDPDWVELPPEILTHLRNKLKELGFWALNVPQEYGGQGLDAVTCCLITEEQFQTTLGTAHSTPFWRPAAVFPALFRGSAYQKEKYLAPLVNGEKIPCIALTEPGAGSDASAIKTTAVRDGGDWIINGTKMFATLAERADFLYVSAITDKSKGRDGISIFLVDRDTPGLSVERIIPMIRPQSSTELVLDNCRVPDRNRLEGAGWNIMQEQLGLLRMLLAQGCVGRALRSLEITIPYVQERVTFGQPLSRRQAIQWMLADSAIDVHLIRLLALEGAWKIDRGMDARQEASMIKVFASEAAFRVVDRCIQCLGGIGLTKDLPLERWFRELRVLRVVEGPNEIHRWVIARNLLRGLRP